MFQLFIIIKSAQIQQYNSRLSTYRNLSKLSIFNCLFWYRDHNGY